MKQDSKIYLSVFKGIDTSDIEKPEKFIILGLYIYFIFFLIKIGIILPNMIPMIGVISLLLMFYTIKTHLLFLTGLMFFIPINLVRAFLYDNKVKIGKILKYTLRREIDDIDSKLKEVKTELNQKLETNKNCIQETNSLLKKENSKIKKTINFRTSIFNRKLRETSSDIRELEILNDKNYSAIKKLELNRITKKCIYRKNTVLSKSIKFLFKIEALKLPFNPDIYDQKKQNEEREYFFNIISDNIDINRESFKSTFNSSWINSNEIDKFLEIKNDTNSTNPDNNIIDAISTLTNEFKIKGLIKRGWEIDDFNILFLYTFHFLENNNNPKINFIDESDYLSFCDSVKKISKIVKM